MKPRPRNAGPSATVGSNRTLIYQEFPVDPLLRPWILAYWEFGTDHSFEHVVVPDGCANIVWAISDRVPDLFFRILGPRFGVFVTPVEAGDFYRGVRIQPGACQAVLGIGARSVLNSVRNAAEHAPALDAVFARATPESSECRIPSLATIQSILKTLLLDQGTPPDLVVQDLVTEIVQNPNQVLDRSLEERHGLSLRQLQRRFKNSVGLTMKQFARIRRVRDLLADLIEPNPASWAELAAKLGFSDQSHLIRELQELSGASPSPLLDRLEAITHRDVHP